MDNNTHGAFIQLPDGAHAFIDGIPDQCDHDWNGKGCHIISYIGGGGYDKMIPIIDDHPDEFYRMDQELRLNGKYISGGCVSCSKCGKPFEPPMFDI